MAIKNIIARGIGFSPGSVKYVPTHGFVAGAAAPPVEVAPGGTWVIADPGRTWPLFDPGRTWRVHPMRVITLDKRPGWDRVYRADLNDFEEIIAGETISNPAVDDVDPADELTLGSASVGTGDDLGMVLVEISEGEAGTIYTLTMSCDLSGGGHLDWRCRLRLGE